MSSLIYPIALQVICRGTIVKMNDHVVFYKIPAKRPDLWWDFERQFIYECFLTVLTFFVLNRIPVLKLQNIYGGPEQFRFCGEDSIKKYNHKYHREFMISHFSVLNRQWSPYTRKVIRKTQRLRQYFSITPAYEHYVRKHVISRHANYNTTILLQYAYLIFFFIKHFHQ